MTASTRVFWMHAGQPNYAYRRLEGASNRKMSDEDERAFESALADIQLLGSGEQVRLAREFALDFARKGVTNPPTLDELLD